MLRSIARGLLISAAVASVSAAAYTYHPIARRMAAAAVSAFAGGALFGHEAIASAPETGRIEVAFSPDGGSEALVERVIGSARHTLRLAAYSFTSPSVVRALLAAKRRGVDVRVVVDAKGNRGRASRAALNLLVNAGIPTRTISVYPIHHDKYIVVDGESVETGSFNYSRAAADRNSENVIVIWNNPQVAAAYTKHWVSRFEQGREYHSAY